MVQLRVGGNIDGWCTRCKLILAHTIEAVVGDTIKRVHCNTCLSKHVYRAYEPGCAPKVMCSASLQSKASLPSNKKSSAKKKTGVAGLVRASDFEAVMKGRDISLAKRYSFKDYYGTGDMVQHINFGLGIVTADKGANKIEVLFQEGPKVLIHGKL